MVSPARKRRAWILLLLTWAVIAGVFVSRYMANARAERQRFDREAQEQAALRAMDKLAAEAEAPEEGVSETPPPSAAPGETEPPVPSPSPEKPSAGD